MTLEFYAPAALFSLFCLTAAGIVAWLQAPGQERRKPSARTIRRHA